MQTWDMNGTLRQRMGARGALPINIPGIGVYECTDGQVFAYLGTPGGAPWPVMLDWMVREGKAEDLAEEPYKSFVENLNMRFLTGLMTQPEKIAENVRMLGHVYEVFQRFCATMSKWTLYEEGQRQRLMFGIVSTPEDLANNPQLTAREWLQDVRHNELGDTVRYAGPPYRLSETPWSIRRRPPLPGEHNREVYMDELGITEDELSRLLAAGVI